MKYELSSRLEMVKSPDSSCKERVGHKRVPFALDRAGVQTGLADKVVANDRAEPLALDAQEVLERLLKDTGALDFGLNVPTPRHERRHGTYLTHKSA